MIFYDEVTLVTSELWGWGFWWLLFRWEWALCGVMVSLGGTQSGGKGKSGTTEGAKRGEEGRERERREETEMVDRGEMRKLMSEH